MTVDCGKKNNNMRRLFDLDTKAEDQAQPPEHLHASQWSSRLNTCSPLFFMSPNTSASSAFLSCEMWRYWFAERDRSLLTSSYSEKQASALGQFADCERFAYSESALRTHYEEALL
ncbi:hypothetical protein QQF64_013006 [Cirrhinus molitorella]|uniref:Uncharacterized protein n=1 Tax=Cirrhinus molitorella TaxID=172907 RepID=A0ABR3LPW9_9TELE